MRRLLLIFICISIHAEVFAIDPRLNWQTIHTDHFSIHFAEGQQPLAEKVAAIAERAHTDLSPLLHWQPLSRTHLVLSDEADVPNGFAMPFPFNRSLLYLVPPDEPNTLEDFDDWLELLIYHEYVHILHLDMATGAISFLREIFGRNVLLFPNMYQPPWIIEGLATYHETDQQRHIGRGQSSLFKMMMQAEVVAGIKPLSQVNLRLRSWPMGASYYLYGVHFFQFIEQRYGQPAIDQLIASYSNNLIPFMINTNARQVLGKDMTALWAEFETWLQQKYPSHSEAQQSPGQALTDTGYFSGPVSAANDGRVYYVKSGPFEHAALFVMDARGEEQKLVNVHARVRMDVSSSGDVLIAQAEYCDLYNLNYDLFLLSPGASELKQITECGRYRSASWSPDGKQIVAVHNAQSLSELHLLDNEGMKQSVLWQGGYGIVVGQPDWSPDGRYLVASVFRPGQGWNIERFDMLLRQWQKITDDSFIDAYPQYNASGTQIVFSSDRSGRYNIYRYDFTDQQLQLLTRVANGAFRPSQANQESPLYYIAYGGNGYDVYRLDEAKVITSESQSIAVVASTPDNHGVGSGIYQAEDYSPWSSLAPRWWFPLLMLDEEKTEVGFTTSGNDALGIHNYVVNAVYDTRNDWFAGSLSYRYASRFAMGFSRNTDILFDTSGYFAVARKEDDAFISYAFPRLKMDQTWNLLVAAFTSHDSDGRRAPGIPPLPDFRDNILGVAGIYDNSKNYIRSISASDGRDVRLVVESSDVWDSDYSGEVYTLDWREYLPLADQQVLALRFTRGYGSGQPDNFELGGEETDFLLAELFLPVQKSVIGRREYPLRGYPDGLPQLRGRRMQLASMEYRFPIGLVERGLMAPPVGIIQWAGSAFIDSGATWNQGDSPDEYFTGVGLELHADVSLFYGLNMKMRLGLASGLDQRLGENRAYFSLGAAF